MGRPPPNEPEPAGSYQAEASRLVRSPRARARIRRDYDQLPKIDAEGARGREEVNVVPRPTLTPEEREQLRQRIDQERRVASNIVTVPFRINGAPAAP